MYYGQNSELVTLTRDCEAVAVPAGNHVVLPEGTEGTITQALGNSFTLYVMGNLFRVSGENADALGKDPLPLPILPENASNADAEDLVWEQLRTCFDPEIPVNIVDLGLVYECKFDHSDPEHRTVDIQMTLTAPGCGMGGVLIDDVKTKVELVPTVARANVELVFDPPWDYSMMSETAKLQTGMFF